MCSYCTLTRKSKIKRLGMPNVGEDVKQFRFSYFHGRIVKLQDHFEKMFGSILHS